MVKLVRLIALFWIVGMIAACGGGTSDRTSGGGTGYCRIPGTGTQSTCEDWSTALSQQNAGIGCQASGGQWSGTACSTSGADGYCSSTYGANVYYYNYGTTLAASHCTGTWHVLTNSSGTPPVAGLMGGSIQGSPLVLSKTVGTLAGTGASGFQNGTGTGASFFNPYGITTDGTNLYVTDTWNSVIRKIVISTGAVTTFSGSGLQGFADGPANTAKFQQPTGITTDGTSLYVAEASNARIRRISISTGDVTTLAGSGTRATVDGTGTGASFTNPWDVTTDGTNLYVVDGSHIRKIVIATKVVSTLTPTDSVYGGAAILGTLYGITTDGTNLYVADSGQHQIRKIVIATNMLSNLAGSGAVGATNGTGAGATFDSPVRITTDGINLYVSDYKSNLIRQIVISTGAVTTLAGSGTAGSTNGSGTSASFDIPWGITTDGVSVFVADYTKSLIRRIQ